MMKKLILTIGMALAGIAGVSAQYSVTAFSPPSGFVFEDLWHVSVTGAGNYTEFYLSLRVFNDQGALQVKSNSSVFQASALPLYANKANMGVLNPVNTLFYNSTLQSIIQSGGLFPVGNYQVQVVLMGRPSDGEFSEMADYTYEKSVDMFWPPLLLSPGDGDTIYTVYPLLAWTPAYYPSSGQQIFYDLVLVELNENQDAYMGVTSNPSTFENRDLAGTVLSYPSSGTALEVGHRYGWQVAATIEGQPVAYSQTWSFVIGAMAMREFEEPELHSELFDDPQPYTHRTAGNYLLIKYVEEYVLSAADDYLQFNVYAWNGRVVLKHTDIPAITISKGHNYLAVDMDDLSSIGSGPYLLEVYNHKNEKQYLRFFLDGLED